MKFIKPYFFLSLVLALLPTYLFRFKIISIPATFLEILIVVFLISVLIESLTNKKEAFEKIRRLGPLNWAVGLFVLAGILSTAISPEPIKALGQLKAFFFEPVLVFYGSILTIKKSNLKFLLASLFISSSLISLFGLIQYITHFGLPLRFWGSGVEPKRIVSVFEYPNALALYLAPLLSFFLILWQKRYEFIKPLYLNVGIITMTGALLLTFSRGAWLAVFLGVLFPFLVSQKARKIMAVALTLLVLILLIPDARQRLSLNDSSITAHKDLFTAGINKVISNPHLGNGLYGFRTTLAEQNFQGEVLNYPHNIFLNFWLELGFLGLLSFALILYLLLSRYKKQPAALKLAAAVYLLVMLLHGLVDVPYFKNDLAVIFWFIASLCILDKGEIV